MSPTVTSDRLTSRLTSRAYAYGPHRALRRDNETITHRNHTGQVGRGKSRPGPATPSATGGGENTQRKWPAQREKEGERLYGEYRKGNRDYSGDRIQVR